jgi:molybdopterin/thiamine biosynthesis adenylyltransferase
MAVDAIRHLKVFDPDLFGKRRVDVIGAGATGSKVVMGLAKLGISNIHAWDFDKVESHNIANQLFGNQDVGKFKVEALAEIVKRDTGTVIQAHNEKVDGTQQLGDIVFLLTDTMASRKEIWEKGIRYKPTIQLMIETRMGSDNGRLYAVSPILPASVKGWEATLYEDDKAERSACGTSITVGSTADVLAGMAVWQVIRWFTYSQKGGEPPEFETLFALNPFFVTTKQAP